MADAGRDRDHALPPRPLGRPRPVGLGKLLPPWSRRRPARALGLSRGTRVPRGARLATRVPGHVRPDVQGLGVRRRDAVHGRGARGAPGATAALSARDLRIPGLERHGHPRVHRRHRPERADRRARAGRRPVRLRGHARDGSGRRRAAGPSERRRGARRLPRLRRQATAAHAPPVASSRSRTASSSPTTAWRSRSSRRTAPEPLARCGPIWRWERSQAVAAAKPTPSGMCPAAGGDQAAEIRASGFRFAS